ncbi:MAG: acyltransferase family protein [Candidatus Gracilibacteria bacterium]|nr:acyltransferase family protein [Candidatus Gracilibacteria bacterium]
MRISWVDNLRGIGIILIVLGHCFFPDNSLLIKFLFTFHVGLFFFLSGYLFNSEKHSDFLLFVKNKFFRLIIPFFIFNIIMFSFYKIKELLGGNVFFVDFDSFFKGIFYASYLPNHSEFILTNIPTWFLVSLFVVSIYYFLLNKFVKNRLFRVIILFLISFLVFIESKYVVFRLPFSMEISLMAMLFYGLGHSYRKEISNFVDKINYFYLILIPFLIFFNIYFVNSTNFSTNFYGNNFLLFLLNGFFGIFLIIIISKIIKQNTFLDFLGKNSILILGLEWVKFLVLSIVIYLSFGYLKFEKSYGIGFIQLISTILFLLPVIFTINKLLLFSSKKIKKD